MLRAKCVGQLLALSGNRPIADAETDELVA